jgi:hexosaminidase
MKTRAWAAWGALAVLAAGGVTGWLMMRGSAGENVKTDLGVVPVPAVYTLGEGHVSLSPDVAITADPGAAEVAEQLAVVLREATGYAVPLRAAGAPPGAVAVTLRTEDPDLGAEGYALTATPNGMSLSANGPAGLFYGVQTVRQLWAAHGSMPVVAIVDRPRFSYRGMMLDVARHFAPVADVKRVIDLAALLKLNHLHLHLTDDQGWRIAIASWPRLTTVGAGTEVGGGPGGFYTQDDYREIVAYAARHFVTVVPEVDLPGHTNAALASYAELNCDGQAPARYTGIDVGFSSLCVSKELTYAFLDDVFGELAELTPGPYLHIGGDEAKTLGAEDYAEIVERAQNIVSAHRKTVIGWHEVAGAKLLPSTVVQFWGTNGDSPEVEAAAGHGNRIIMSPANRAYLDMKYDDDTRLGLSWAGYISVPDAYDWDPALYLSNVHESAILGVEAPLWTETVRTLDDIEFLAMPRLAVMAELGWSPATRHNWDSLRSRLAVQEGLWTRLGVSFYQAPEVPWSGSP